jgi:GNAT superfamily N-acetyltransferase
VLDPDNPFFGPLAGMTLLLAPALRGRGLLRALYAHLLDQMIARGAHTFRGGTSQAPVMRLAVEMERPLQGWLLRRRAHFPVSHFGAFAP